jgi:hypothetical protein
LDLRLGLARVLGRATFIASDSPAKFAGNGHTAQVNTSA